MNKKGHGPSFLRWAGSKRKSLAVLASCFQNPSLEYVEPFAGSAALFFRLAPKGGVLGDLNGHLINAMRQVRDRPDDVYEELLRLKRGRDEYYRARDEFNGERPYGIRSAVLFIYLNRNCFNGLWRTNLSGRFNVPYGGMEMGEYPPYNLFLSCSKSLAKVKLRHQDFRKTLMGVGENAFIYADPPYFTANERTFVEYGKKSFSSDDLMCLISLLKQADINGAKIAFTYCDVIPSEIVPKGWSRRLIQVTRNVGGFSGYRKKQAEVLFTNFDLMDEM